MTRKKEANALGEAYEIRLYDTPLLSFTFSKDAACVRSVAVKDALRDASRDASTDASYSGRLMPLDMEPTCEGVWKWLSRRIIPKNRAYVHNILNAMGLSVRNVKGIIGLCRGLSLNDSYWVVPEGFAGSFANYNLFENRFSQILALTALAGESIGEDKARKVRTSPEFTTDGALPKTWLYRNGKIILFKGGIWRQYASAPDPLEPYSEYYAAQIADAMGLIHVKYGLSRWKGILGCSCELFTNIDTSFVPMASVVRKDLSDAEQSRYYSICGEWFLRFDRENGSDLYEHFASTLVFDSLILNEDRHLGNFGVLRDSISGRIIGSAPVFDNGISLFNFSSIQELRKLDAHRKAYLNYFKSSFDAQTREFGGERQKESLARLSRFRFKKHNRYNWDAERMEIIENYVRRRAVELIEIIRGG